MRAAAESPPIQERRRDVRVSPRDGVSEPDVHGMVADHCKCALSVRVAGVRHSHSLRRAREPRPVSRSHVAEPPPECSIRGPLSFARPTLGINAPKLAPSLEYRPTHQAPSYRRQPAGVPLPELQSRWELCGRRWPAWGSLTGSDLVGRPGLDPGTLGLKVPCSSG